MSKTVTGASSVAFTTRPSMTPLRARPHDGGEIAMVHDGVGVRGMQTEPRRERRHRGEVSVTVTVDERKPHDCPRQPTVAQHGLGGHLARRVGGGRRTRVGLTAGLLRVRVVHVAGARHHEASLRRVGLDGLDQVAGAVEVGSPDRVVVGRTEQGREMDDRLDSFHRSPERVGIIQITADPDRTPAGSVSSPRRSARQCVPSWTRRGSSRDPTRPLAPVRSSVLMMFSLPDCQCD